MSWLSKPGKELPCTYLRCLVMIVSVAIVTGATAERQLIAAESEPNILNLALPRALVPVDPKTRKGMEDNVKRLFENLYCLAPDCKGNRPLQINIALGNDYQILDWLGKGWIDGAAIPALSLYLLRRDDVDLVEVDHTGWKRPVLKLLREGYVPPQGLEDFWQEIWEHARLRTRQNDEPSAFAGAKDGCPLIASSHLSTRGFLAPVAATSQWLGKRLASDASTSNDSKATDRLANEFWHEFFDHVRFTFDVDQPAPANPGSACAPIILGGKQPAGSAGELPGGADYHLVITARRAATIFPTADMNKIPLHMKQAVAPELDSLQKIFPKLPKPESKDKEDEEKDSIPETFWPIIFPEPYFGVRTFAFTVDESIDLLRQQQETKEDMLALILPGGGVKAGFQSRLIEYLYGNEQLKNYNSSRTVQKGKTLDVSYVIGTSGGALLGFFVAQLGDHPPRELSKLLWEVNGRPLQSTDVFGFFDLPRYFSFLAVLAMLCLVLWSPALRRMLGGSFPASQQVAPNRLWRLRLLLTIGPILLLTPLLVRYVNGEASKEHIPEVEGFFYAIFVLIAMFADQCLIVGAKKTTREPKSWRVLAILSFFLGAVALFASVFLRCQSSAGESLNPRFCEPIFFLEIQLGALLACLGVFGVLMASIIWTACSSAYSFTDRRGYFSGVVGVGLVHIVLVYLTLWALLILFRDSFSLLELTTTFWYWLLGTALLIAVLLVWISYRPFMPRVFRTGVDYLSANHPNGNVVARRFLRLLLLAVLSVMWWNFIVAPGLYGNKHANKSITDIIRGFDLALNQANPATDQPSYLTSRLIIPANVLERDGTRYFLFAPTEKNCPDLVRRPGDGATWRLFHVDGSRKEPEKILVQRCGVKEKPYNLEYLKKVVFASGSPFPVFPAHRVDKESLVDGGYSNNVPLDAAQTVSADLVLIVESSNPLGHTSLSSWWRYLAIQGELIGSLPRLLSFLYERSQQIDRLSRSGLFVVSLAPPREEADWPFLVDFRPKTVNRMREVAEKNLSRRIGMVQSWGRPRFQSTVRIGHPPQ